MLIYELDHSPNPGIVRLPLLETITITITLNAPNSLHKAHIDPNNMTPIEKNASHLTTSPATYKKDLKDILTVLNQLKDEMITTVRQRITMLELNNQRINHIETHLGFKPLSHNPNTIELELIQEDTPVTHVPLQLNSRPPILKPSLHTTTIQAPPFVPNTTQTFTSSINPSASFDTSLFTQNDKLKAVIQNYLKIENTMGILTTSVQKLVASLGDSTSDKASLASPN
ncbi:hypothetical protein C1646_772953 [Rhizophagus diaphanus]|nr:hypothetical protein C1646_772953 [Rhizophagus diaphanus] [Rhizophagus sp. MUCL 43196]